ncbi:MAG: DUF488 domain-containing protein [Geminicoccaceae bacterium]|nr:DUF488 domain-containing protein [Geminicoccaceae bacterium]MDW8341048.1 DUF488 domain-containing protein [Geminicoccaceae bacterium]
MKLFTIGFTKKSAETFFTALERAGVRRVIDVRLDNSSQLAGFTKKDDLAFFLKKIAGIDYVHLPNLAPTREMLDGYKKRGGSWEDYERKFLALMRERAIQEKLDRALFDHACLLCSEHEPHRCHRRLVAEYLREHWGDIETRHL